MIPQPVNHQITSLLGSRVNTASSESGGSINAAYRISLADSRIFFLKINKGSLYAMFEAEAKGLAVLSEACKDIRVPGVIGLDTTDNGQYSWLLIDYVDSSRPGSGFFSHFGRGLASLHRHSTPRFGLDHDNYIGSLYQPNTPHETWSEFYTRERLMPQMKAAVDSGLLSPGLSRNFNNLYVRLHEIFPDEPPALLHGDLWGGNYLCDHDGLPVIIDPAVYYGHREMEIAFTKLFGGYEHDFYTAYNEAWPLGKGHEQRVDICNLYPLLVHTNLFGSSYAGRVVSIIKRF
ncbi:MAG: fructosamine kinase family protein [Cyclonatronaceae bacterium]